MSMGYGHLMWSSRFNPERPRVRKPVDWRRLSAFFLPYWRAELLTLACIVAGAALGRAPPRCSTYPIDAASPAGAGGAGAPRGG